MSKDIARCWEFPSGSNPNKKYEALQYTDGSTSCNCMGWTRRVAADGSRSCKHTRMIDMGTADREASATHDYTKAGVAKRPTQTTPAANLAAKRKSTPAADQMVAPGRKILWNRNG